MNDLPALSATGYGYGAVAPAKPKKRVGARGPDKRPRWRWEKCPHCNGQGRLRKRSAPWPP